MSHMTIRVPLTPLGALTVLIALALLGAPIPAGAGPTLCSPRTGIVAICEGDQSAGVANGQDYNSQSVDVRNLTSDIARPRGKAGILQFVPSGATGTLRASFSGGQFGIDVGGASVPGIHVGGQGANGSSPGFHPFSAGGTGGNGGALSTSSVQATGRITTSGAA